MLKDFGADLKAFRESRNITIAEISSETRINPKFLLNFEAGIFDFQPETYIRSFLREYARIIGLDEIEVIGDYERARSGFYNRKYYKPYEQKKEEIGFKDEPVVREETKPEEVIVPPVLSVESVKETKTEPATGKKPYLRKTSYEEEEVSPNKAIYQKIFLGVIILGVLVGLYFIYDYISGTTDQNADVKPKSFDEMTTDYENKINRQGNKELEDSLARIKEQQLQKQMQSSDSLSLVIVAVKDVRFKSYIDNGGTITEGQVAAGDTVIIKAKDSFRFSANTSQNVELFLYGRKLEKPKAEPGAALKNLRITRNGVVQQ
jgi:transcriptional regulator with XRE-family HTH domain